MQLRMIAMTTLVFSRRAGILLPPVAASSAASARARGTAFISQSAAPFCLQALLLRATRTTATTTISTANKHDSSSSSSSLSYLNDKLSETSKDMFFSTMVTTAPSPPAITREPLPSSKLRWKCNPNQFDSLFNTTADLEGLQKGTLLNQNRASSAIEFGIGMKNNQKGYNLYVLGPTGSGKRTLIRNYLEQHSLSEPPASDWAYVYNFEDDQHDHPTPLRLPAGLGTCLRDDLKQLIEDIKIAIPAALESDKHRQDVKQAKEKVFEEQTRALNELSEEANQHDLVLIGSAGGFVLGGPASSSSPSSEGQEGADDARLLTPEKKQQMAEDIEKLQPKLDEIVNRFPQLKREADKKVKELSKEAAKNAIAYLFSPLKTFYKDLPDVIAHLEAVEANVVERAEDIRHSKDDEQPENIMSIMMKPRNKPVPFEQYNINLIVDNNETLATGAPVIYEENPLYYNLIGKTEHLSQFGTLVTDFSLIKAGSLHRANGGYLVLNARDVLMKPFSWEALKRCLRSGSIKIESLGEEYGLISTASLQPEPIELDVKVVLLGDRLLYYLLSQYDPEFNDLFKVAADFDDEMDQSPEACRLFAQMLATLAQDKDLKPLDRGAVAAMIEQAARQVGDQEKLSTHLRSFTDLLSESDYWAGVDDDAQVISKEHVTKAIDQQIYRADRIRELIYEQIRRGTILVDVKGSHIGQVNGLSVMSLGNLMFGRPSRITATARLGRGKVLDIEREVELGGPLHSKGVMILSSFLSSRYALDCPLCLSANLVFEQSYGQVEGDSASMAELCALLSTLSNVPIKQGLAITGSVNQFGEAQAIGGVTEKIEGFYDVCAAMDGGLTAGGDQQGVLIPESNLAHLMLRPEVLKAVDEGKFAVYTYKNVNDALELLTGVEAGVRREDDDGSSSYPVDTINYLVDQRLHEFADMARKFSSDGNNGADSSSKDRSD